MGTTGLYQKPHDVKAYMDGLYTWENEETGKRTVLKSAIVNMREYYCAVEHIAPDGTRRVWAGVAKLSYGGRNDDCQFYYKDMDESVGPYFNNCPETILDLLTPVEREGSYAHKWRADCRAVIAARKAKPKLVAGATIRLTPPADTGIGQIELVEVVDARRSLFRIPGKGQYRMGWIKSRQYVAA